MRLSTLSEQKPLPIKPYQNRAREKHPSFSLSPLGMPDESVQQEFLDEIQLMKAVGSHKNIVSMVGCCTVEEPMFLLVEYAPYGDLLISSEIIEKRYLYPLSIYSCFEVALPLLGRFCDRVLS